MKKIEIRSERKRYQTEKSENKIDIKKTDTQIMQSYRIVNFKHLSNIDIIHQIYIQHL